MACVITEEAYQRDQFLLPYLHRKFYIENSEYVVSMRTGEYVGIPRMTGDYGGINFNIDGKRYFFNTHKMIWVLINGLVPVGYLINHKDGIKSNCHIGNLELNTVSENTKHAYLMGLIAKRKST